MKLAKLTPEQLEEHLKAEAKEHEEIQKAIDKSLPPTEATPSVLPTKFTDRDIIAVGRSENKKEIEKILGYKREDLTDKDWEEKVKQCKFVLFNSYLVVTEVCTRVAKIQQRKNRN